MGRSTNRSRYRDGNADTALSALAIDRTPFTMLDGNVQGYANQRTVAINPVAEQPVSTLFHELAHVVFGAHI
jgi:hypothetical protein